MFVSHLVSRIEVDSSELAKTTDFADTKWVTGGRLLSVWSLLGVGGGPRPEGIVARPEAYITYKLTYKCKDCGKQWTRLSVKEVPIPESYVESEGEKMEYDAEREVKEAKEEEYAR